MGINRLQSGQHHRKEWEPHTTCGLIRLKRDKFLAEEENTRTSLALKQYREKGQEALDGRNEAPPPVPGIPRIPIRSRVVYPTEYRIAESARIIYNGGTSDIAEEVREEVQRITSLRIIVVEPRGINPYRRPWDGDVDRVLNSLDLTQIQPTNGISANAKLSR